MGLPGALQCLRIAMRSHEQCSSIANQSAGQGMTSRDLDFASEYDAALRAGTPKAAVLSVLLGLIFFASLIGWAWWAELEEVTRGEGKVIPSSKIQLVQSLEGGLLKELLVRAGDKVAKGDIWRASTIRVFPRTLARYAPSSWHWKQRSRASATRRRAISKQIRFFRKRSRARLPRSLPMRSNCFSPAARASIPSSA
jgi:hypothetical protein